MALQGSGQIKLSEIATEFGGSAPHQMSEYHDKGNAPASGEIQLAADFYGTSNNFTLTVSSNQQQMNLASYASSNGWDGSSAAIITIASGVHITTSNTTAALSTGSFPGGLTILNSGNIHGDGGNGGDAANGYGPGANGSAAGHAIAVTNSTSLSITNNSGGVIAGGGGGGGAGSACYVGCRWFGGGGGGGRCGNGHTTSGGWSNYASNGSSGTYSSAGGGGGNGASGGNWGSAGGTGNHQTWSGGSGGSGGSAVSGSYTLTANNGTMYG